MNYIIAGILICVLLWFVVGGLIIYPKTGKLKWFFHDVLEYHEPTNDITFDGLSQVSICKHCGREILQDSQGNWFTTNNTSPKLTWTEKKEK